MRTLLLTLALMAVVFPCARGLCDHNPYGIQVSYIGGRPTDYVSKHYDDASRLVGEWGHIRVGSDLHLPPEASVIPTLIACRAKRLIPILTGQVPPGMNMPDDLELDPDGTYDSQARFFEDWARAIYDAGFTIPFYEMGNEPQGRWPAETHARWCMAAAKAFHRVDPGIRVSPAGMAGPAVDYYREMLTAVPELKDHMSVWSCHPYAANRPPQYDADDLSIQGYRWTVAVLEECGVDDPKIICTETGWELCGHSDKRFPYVTEALRAEYIVEAWTQYWAVDPSIVAVTPFMLQSLPWTGWETWDFIREDGSYTPMYHAMAAIPKPKGRDHQPVGDAVLEGRVTEAKSGVGLSRCFVWIVPAVGAGAYAAETDGDGRYRIEGAPAGDWLVSARKSDYDGPGRFPVPLEPGRTARHDLVMRHHGMLRTGFDSPEDGGLRSGGFQPLAGDPSVYSWDGATGRTRPGSLRIRLAPGAEAPARISADYFHGKGDVPHTGGEHAYWIATDYCAALPGECYAVEAWVRTEDFDPGPDGGIRVVIECTNGSMIPYGEAWGPGPSQGTHDWTPVNLTVHAPEKSRRHRIVLSVRGRSGTVWFDDVYAAKAAVPVPSAALLDETLPAGVVRGRVSAADESILHEATVYLTPGNYNAVTDRVGRYRIEGVPEGVYRLSASHAKWSSHHFENVRIAGDAVTVHDITLPNPDWPADLVNGDMEIYGEEFGLMVGWKPHGICDGDGAVRSGWMKGRADPDHPGFMARSGRGLLGYVSAYNTKTGASYQTVKAEPNALYELSAWIKTCRRGGVRGDVANRIGIDPMGLDDPLSPYIIWTPYRPSPDAWSEVRLRARANRDRITILLGHQMISGIAWSGNFFDDVVLTRIAPGDERHDAGRTEGVGDAHLPFGFE